MNREKELALKKIMNEDSTVLAEIEASESVDAFCAVFAKRGIEMSQEEASELLQTAVSSSPDGELDENSLDAVAGGGGCAAIAWGVGARVGILGRMVYDYCTTGNPFKNYSPEQLITGSIW